MRKIIAAVIAAGFALAGSPAFAGTPDPVHLTVEDLHCYQVGLVLGSNDSPCTDPIACVPGDATCAWVCDIDNEAFTVECSTAEANPGLLNWLGILYRTIDHYRADATQRGQAADRLAAKVTTLEDRDASLAAKVQRKNARIAHLREALAKARHHR